MTRIKWRTRSDINIDFGRQGCQLGASVICHRILVLTLLMIGVLIGGCDNGDGTSSRAGSMVGTPSFDRSTAPGVSTTYATPRVSTTPSAISVTMSSDFMETNAPLVDSFVPAGRDAIITRVIDGDTFHVEFMDSSTDVVRLLGVDTPETYNLNKSGEYRNITDTKCLDLWAVQATQFAKARLLGRTVTLVADKQAGERGSFDRLLAYVWLRDKDFGEELLLQGLARVYTEGRSVKEGDYILLESRAVVAGAGLWNCGASKTEELSSKEDRFFGVIIECISYDGDVPRIESDEYVQLANLDNVPVNLYNWRLSDKFDGSPVFIFPDYEMGAGVRIRVYTNEYHVDWGGFSFELSRPIWNNSHPDVAILVDGNGQQISETTYPPGC
ncbi:hypothetical protein FIM12_04315 [SAR202 cluster bacterium AD-804-J14_MRT_500m]|nr:hypothetical protein [SAR202 cluster bacterium AD-804-J14_MRT_500m]